MPGPAADPATDLTAGFYAAADAVSRLDDALDPAHYRPAPADWLLVLTDIEHSTEAIERGRQKAVNMIAAACIAAVRNAVAGQELPFAFGGDGATLLIPPVHAPTALAALVGVRATAAAQGLALRVGAIAVSELRARGHDLLVARYAAAPAIAFAMFRGGGVGFLDRVLKGREPGVPPELAALPADVGEPDLSGLSCRWEPIGSRAGRTVSLVVSMLGKGEDYRPVLGRLLEIAGDDVEPVSADSLARVLARRWFPKASSISVEQGAVGRRSAGRLRILFGWFCLQMSLRFGLGLGGRNARDYLAETARHSDFCKADDGLQMVIDCTPASLAEIERYLGEREAEGVLAFGLHVSDSALMTCLVDATDSHHHVHFIDGAGGGYTRAAKIMKEKLARRAQPAA